MRPSRAWPPGSGDLMTRFIVLVEWDRPTTMSSRRGGTSPSAWMEGAVWRRGGQIFPAFVFAPRDDGDDNYGGSGDGNMGENRYWDVKDFARMAEPQL